MYWLYTFLLSLAMVFYLPFYYIRLRLRRGRRLCLRERLGFRPPSRIPGNQPAIWFHAVSVGEVLSLRPLLSRLKQSYPDWRIYLSVLTETGMKVAVENVTQADRIFYVPFDLTWIVHKFFRILKPDVFVLAESEFWPNLLKTAGRFCPAVILINGRISPGSFKRYSRFKPLFLRITAPINYFLVQTNDDAKRLRNLGIEPDLIQIAGNLKAEIKLPPLSEEDSGRFKKELGIGPDARVVVAGSTHKGEEELLLKAFAQVKSGQPDLFFILAPRHPERTPDLEKLALGFGLRVQRRTAFIKGKKWDVLLVDTLGELARFYSLGDAAFVGGSLVEWGGQNLLEPAFYGKPIFFGPHMFNFAQLADLFVRKGAAEILQDEKSLLRIFSFEAADDLKERGQKAQSLLQSLSGAADKTLKVLEEAVKREKSQ